jgi:hypothetical protein
MIETKGAMADLKQRCVASLKNVSHIPEQHPQYKRYVFLKKKVGVLVGE